MRKSRFTEVQIIGMIKEQEAGMLERKGMIMNHKKLYRLYIEMFYNAKRKHTNNGMLSPVDFETRQLNRIRPVCLL
ncbi:hypothetical protein E2K80_00940 [Rhodophyticola sp. CCM32]|uniref:hypothetical protein n=1 Tax=Rhodophyticola sp. CCM32 TaxID=2916397 RepID=UPI00107F5F88|nr:hypothetical protein [Rhodophyticola sp. CCM32]QBX99465.1 hypothetical protein E2K80_00940 [Rhodophyticola sp. CCM32]